MSDRVEIDNGDVLDEDDLVNLSLLKGLENWPAAYDGKKYLVSGSESGNTLKLTFEEMSGDRKVKSFVCDFQSGQLSNFVDCNASDVRAFINGAKLD